MSNREEKLKGLLLSLFQPRQFRRYLRSRSHLYSLVDELPSADVAPSRYFDTAVELLIQRGLLNAQLFDELQAERPGRAKDIEAIAQLWRSAPTEGSPLPTVLVLTALEMEYEAVRAYLSKITPRPHPRGTFYEQGLYPAISPRCRVVVGEIGPRNSSAAQETQRALDFLKPSYALFLGVAGGRKDVAVGDVVLGSKVYGYEGGKVTADGLLPRPEAHAAGNTLLSYARKARRDWNRDHPEEFRAFVAAIAAGEKVVASSDSEIARLLTQSYGDSLAVAMEDFGFAEAAQRNGVEAMVIRGISDLLDGKAAADEGGSQPRAAQNAATLLFQILELLPMPS